MKELETTTTTSSATTKGINSANDMKQGSAAAEMLQSTRSALMYSSAKTETFEDMYDYECDNSSTSTGFDDHDHDSELQDDDEEEEEEEEEEQQGGREVDRRFHLHQHHSYHLRMQRLYSDDKEEGEDKERRDEVEEAAVAGSRQTGNTLDHAHHHRALEHSHGGNPAEEEGVQATTTTTTTPPPAIVTSSSHSAPNPDVDVHDGDDIHQGCDDVSTSPPRSQSQQQQYTRHSNGIDTPNTQQTTTTAPSITATPPELNPKSPSRLSIPRSIHFRANTPTDRSGAGSPLGRLQVHTVNRLEVENSFLLNQNNSLTRDIHHCRQTVQALKQILAQREDTIGRMKQEVHQAHLKIKFMDSLLSGRSSLPGQQQLRSYQVQPLQQHGPRYQPQQQQEQLKGLEGDWKERHRLDDDYDDDVEAKEKEEGERGVEGLERSSSLLDMYAAQDEPPFNWLLKGWDEGKTAVAEASNRDSAGEDEEEYDEEEEDRVIPRQVRSIFSGMNDDEQYNSDEYTDEDDEDDEEYDDDEDEDEDEGGLERGRVDRPRSGDFQGSGIYHNHNQQQPLSGNNGSGESLSMSLGNNSTCILAQESDDDHDDDDDDDDEDACDTNAMGTVNGDGCVIISGDRPPSPVSLPSPALSESSMSLESQSEGSNVSVTSLSCSSLTSTSTSTSNISVDEKDGTPQQHRQQGSMEITPSSTSLSSGCGIDQQVLQLPTVVPYSSFRDSGHFPTQVFTMDFEEQHLIVVDETDLAELEAQSAFRPFSPTTTASLLTHNDDSAPTIPSPSFPSFPSPPTANKKGLSIETGNGLTSAATTLIQAKDASHHAPLCQPNGNHPCLGTSPPMAAPLALISRVHIEINASSTTLISVSTPSPTTTTTTMTGGNSIGQAKSTEALLSAKEIVATAGIETSGQVDKEAVADDVVTKECDDADNNSSVPSTPTTPTTTSWGPSSLFKGLLPSRRKSKSRSFKSKDKNTNETDGRLSPEASEVLITRKEDVGVVVLKEKEQSVAWAMLKKNQSCAAIEPLPAATAVEREVLTSAPIVSGPAAVASSTLFSRVFGGGRSNRTKT
ncbi:hypothetical protein EC957_009539 [Mortierella hygrophila]|uniref:Uncharacterized protein n=1 Tax=Mortierella hygrophila TaxID=979708 RepID=A0A9P6FB08_9FUNG|nr:hypothetical protein EC957_009539 [Mortierella hygrophila]